MHNHACHIFSIHDLDLFGRSPELYITQNPLVFAWVPAVAIFFNDPDGHLLEYIGILDGASKPENGIITYAQWKELEGK